MQDLEGDAILLERFSCQRFLNNVAAILWRSVRQTSRKQACYWITDTPSNLVSWWRFHIFVFNLDSGFSRYDYFRQVTSPAFSPQQLWSCWDWQPKVVLIADCARTFLLIEPDVWFSGGLDEFFICSRHLFATNCEFPVVRYLGFHGNMMLWQARVQHSVITCSLLGAVSRAIGLCVITF